MTRSLVRGAVLALFALLVPRAASAQTAFNVGHPYDPGTAANNERCVYADATITQVLGSIQFLGKAAATIWSPSAGCNTNWVYAPANSVAVNYQLWKVDQLNAGHTATACESGATWDYIFDLGNYAAVITSPGLGGPSGYNYSKGCGSGYYNLGIEGYVLVNGVWKGGTLFSGWQYMDLTPPPPPR
jgi:hypothetical protein